MVRFDRITMDLEKLNGQPYIRGTKITVQKILQAMAVCCRQEDILREYPELEEEDLSQAFKFAAANMGSYDIECEAELPAA